ncbi:hypothetical protein BLNAU_17646 [Blattamonas nauphoetae]|uniref:Uncharacterized protein n=1 Tax=Blattamonas nauphoetae TaxID=2049346 RepID=A0ABQ9X6R9_9EUKA|nr:hypothetical protein BLNAU_17646 [Blattamonas nauphoetae]
MFLLLSVSLFTKITSQWMNMNDMFSSFPTPSNLFSSNSPFPNNPFSTCQNPPQQSCSCPQQSPPNQQLQHEHPTNVTESETSRKEQEEHRIQTVKCTTVTPPSDDSSSKLSSSHTPSSSPSFPSTRTTRLPRSETGGRGYTPQSSSSTRRCRDRQSFGLKSQNPALRRLERKIETLKKKEERELQRCTADCRDEYERVLDDLHFEESSADSRQIRRNAQRESEACVRDCKRASEEKADEVCDSVKFDGYDACDQILDDWRTESFDEKPGRRVKTKEDARREHRQCLEDVDELIDQCMLDF